MCINVGSHMQMQICMHTHMQTYMQKHTNIQIQLSSTSRLSASSPRARIPALASHLPRKSGVDVTKCHACHAKDRGVTADHGRPSAQQEPAQCRKCHACCVCENKVVGGRVVCDKDMCDKVVRDRVVCERVICDKVVRDTSCE